MSVVICIDLACVFGVNHNGVILSISGIVSVGAHAIDCASFVVNVDTVGFGIGVIVGDFELTVDNNFGEG
jgi:hypothetical protein